MGKDKKKHKKKSSKHKKHKTSKHKSSTDDSSSSEGEWVEASETSAATVPPPQLKEEKEKNNVSSEREEWFSSPALFACISREEIRRDKEKEKVKNETDKYMLDKLGQTDRELNPYWKDGGSGLPENRTSDCLRQASVTVGDQGAAWLRKALQRAKEQAVAQCRPLDQVVAERWGSLENLENMIAVAEERDQNKNYNEKKFQNRHGQTDHFKDRLDYKKTNENMERRASSKSNKYCDDFRRTKNGNKESSDSNSSDTDEKSCKNKKYSTDNRRKRKHFARPDNSSDDNSEDNQRRRSKHGKHLIEHKAKRRIDRSESSDYSDEGKTHSKYKPKKYDRNRKSNKSFAKPSESSTSCQSEDNSYSHEKQKYYFDKDKKANKDRTKEGKRSFAKPRHDSDDESSATKLDRFRLEGHKSYLSSGRGWKKTTQQKIQVAVNCDKKLLQVEPNKLESETEEPHVTIEEPLLTDKEMNDLGAKLVKAELLGNQELVDQLKARLEKARERKATGQSKCEVTKEVVILTHTDSKGFTRPVSLGGIMEPTGGRRKAKKVETHSGGKRTRYFADDDNYSLQEMFQREKLNTVEDSNEMFAKLASKGVGRDESARDMDDVFEETACMEESLGRKQAKDRQQAIEHSKRTARSLENCQWCLESHHMLKHLIIAIGKTCYLCVPPYQSLTETHCLIVPSCHTPCATQLDEDVWREMQDFRRSVVEMFQSKDEDVVFFESARYLTRFPHMVLNCVPMPKEVGDLAPIYFKKAIQECEMEWSNNKKLVDLRGRDIRRAVPKGLPYFAVDFGMDNGFAHVIEDEKLFPNNFAQEIIGGMMDLDHSIWRKQRRQTFEEQSKKVIQLSKLWTPFDITKKAD